jgi:hypothetical protein
MGVGGGLKSDFYFRSQKLADRRKSAKLREKLAKISA